MAARNIRHCCGVTVLTRFEDDRAEFDFLLDAFVPPLIVVLVVVVVVVVIVVVVVVVVVWVADARIFFLASMRHRCLADLRRS